MGTTLSHYLIKEEVVDRKVKSGADLKEIEAIKIGHLNHEK
jgi:hypothetical protein